MKNIVSILFLVALILNQTTCFEQQQYDSNKEEFLKDLLQKLVYSQKNDLNGKILMQSMMEAALDSDFNLDTKCFTCRTAVNYINTREQWEEESKEAIEAILYYLCATGLDLFPASVCKGAIEEFAPYVYDSLWQHYINSDFICPAINLCPPVYQKVDVDAIVEDILKDMPEKKQLIPSEKEVLKFVHFSDPHTDDNYSTEFNAKCSDPACCIPTSGPAETEEQKPGYWGTYGVCDLPTRTFEQMINYIDKFDEGFDFMLWTGDNTGHNIWDQTFEANLENTKQQTDIIKKIMPDMQVYPIQGNHESFPVNIYDFDKEDKFNDFFSEQWGDWIGQDAREQIKENGFYETTAYDGRLKIIALNTQAAVSENFTLLYNPTDPGRQLEILRASLQDAEDKDQAVYIMAHIPSSSFTRPFVRIFQALMDRYSNTVRSLFTGHTHDDQYELFYAQDGVTPIVPNFIAPSTTTYGGRNPSFRIVEFDSETFQILNIRQFRLDLGYWNQFTDPNTQLLFEEVYDFISEYKMENLWDLKNLDILRDQIYNDLDVYNKYNFNFSSGTAAPQDKINHVRSCGIYPGQKEIQECLNGVYVPNPLELLAGPWIEKIQKN